MSEYAISIAILGVLPSLIFFGMAAIEGTRGRGPSPMRVMAWTFMLGYALKSLYLAYAVDRDAPFATDWLSRDIIDLGQLATFLFIAALVAGYIASTLYFEGRPPRVPRPKPVGMDMTGIYWGVFALSCGLMIAFFIKMDFIDQLVNLRFAAAKQFIQEETGVASSLGFLTVGADILLIFFAYRLANAPMPRLWDIHLLALYFSSLCFMLSSRRSGVLIIMILLVLVVTAARARSVPATQPRRRSRLATGAIGAGFALLLLAFVGQVRTDGETAARDIDIVRAVETTAGHFFEGAYFLDPAKVSVIITETRRRGDYLLGSSIGAVIFTPIPRVIWPEKPVIRIGPYVGQELLGYNNRSGAPPGAVGELYMNFGWGGIVAGGLIFGLLLGHGWARFRASDATSQPIVRYVLTVMFVLFCLNVDFGFAILTLIKYIAAASIASAYWRHRRPARAHTRSAIDLPRRRIPLAQ
ncbi:hypothetical protein [uncultured Jannaschia sp.]|uniref:hypothetical protein n=1 Tax=uncultured Jannaschia sp. TaxID=293347 RepID=UPI002638B7C9|nr:hypothetical protein [uncultured Jannaschia sp.]